MPKHERPELFVPEGKLETLDSDHSHFLRCTETGVIYNMNASASTEYESKYFLEDYKQQYGLNYIEEEFQHRNRAKHILQKLRTYASADQNQLLEIGCAAGFFLHEAQRAGFTVQGLDVSRFAHNYAQEVLRLNVSCDSFENFPMKKNAYDIIAFFYTLEHLPKQPSALQKMISGLKSNGLLVFSVPSTHGPLFNFHRKQWFATHPKDHYIDYNPVSLTNLFQRYSLDVLFLEPAAFHPERFWKGCKYFPLNLLYRTFARRICFADTLIGIVRKKQ